MLGLTQCLHVMLCPKKTWLKVRACFIQYAKTIAAFPQHAKTQMMGLPF